MRLGSTSGTGSMMTSSMYGSGASGASWPCFQALKTLSGSDHASSFARWASAAL